MLSVPVHVMPGDHDMEPGGLTDFYRGPRRAAAARESRPFDGSPLPVPRLLRRRERRAGFPAGRASNLPGCERSCGGAATPARPPSCSCTAIPPICAATARAERLTRLHRRPWRGPRRHGAHPLQRTRERRHDDLRGDPLDRADRGGAGRLQRRDARRRRRQLALQGARRSLSLRDDHLARPTTACCAAKRQRARPAIARCAPASSAPRRSRASNARSTTGPGGRWRADRRRLARGRSDADGRLVDIDSPGLHRQRPARPARDSRRRARLRAPAARPTGSDADAVGPWPENGMFGTAARTQPQRPQMVAPHRWRAC